MTNLSPTGSADRRPTSEIFARGPIGRARLRRAAAPFVAKAPLYRSPPRNPRLKSFFFLSLGFSLGFGFWDFARLRFSMPRIEVCGSSREDGKYRRGFRTHTRQFAAGKKRDHSLVFKADFAQKQCRA